MPFAIRVFHWSAASGLLVVVAATAILDFDLATTLLLGGVLVCVPLALALAHETAPAGVRRGYALAALCQPFAGFCLVYAFALVPGMRAALWSLPWLGFTGLVALLGVERFRRLGRHSAGEGAIAAGLVFLSVGGTWTTLSRYGARPLDFLDIIVLLTGVHFHYAGLVLPVLTGLAGREQPGVGSRLAAWSVVCGVPLVALGITVGPHWPLVEALAAWFMTAGALMSAGIQARRAWHRPLLERMLLLASALALAGGVALASAYALGVYLHRYWFTIERMILWHGALNAIGYALLGLLGWSFGRARWNSASPQPKVN